jgi:glycosyltransferase involved in cell wall biosynthesis
MKVAAVIPVRNRAHLVGRAIQSALDQTYPISEIIVVDDGSTDNTIEVAKSFKDQRVRIIQQSGKGACAARNTGWRSSRADWIGFLDSDDIWMPVKIEAQIACCRIDQKTVACFTGFAEVGNGSEHCYNPPAQAANLLDLQKGNGIGPTSISLIKRSALEATRGWDEDLPSCQDWDLWLKLRPLGQFGIIPLPLVRFEQSGKDRISRNLDAVLRGHDIVFGRVIKSLKGHDRRIVAAMHAAHMSDIMNDFGRHEGAIHFAIKSIALRPNRYALSILLKRLMRRT